MTMVMQGFGKQSGPEPQLSMCPLCLLGKGVSMLMCIHRGWLQRLM